MISEKSLLVGEKVIRNYSSEKLLLTNFRLRHFSSNNENEKISSVTLESIGLMELIFKRQIEILIVGIVMMVISGILFYLDEEEIPIYFSLVGLTIIIAYFLIGKTNLIIHCNGGGKISISSKNNNKEKYLEIIQNIEMGKIERGKNLTNTYKKSDFY
jgi:ABC-type multidrug transport system fused ATPase/permease subunit